MSKIRHTLQIGAYALALGVPYLFMLGVILAPASGTLSVGQMILAGIIITIFAIVTITGAFLMWLCGLVFMLIYALDLLWVALG
jgi:hypothetical protein